MNLITLYNWMRIKLKAKFSIVPKWKTKEMQLWCTAAHNLTSNMKNPFAPSSRIKNKTKGEKKIGGREKEGSVSLVHLMQWCSLKCMCALRAGTRASGAEPQRLISDLPPALSTTAAAPLASPPLELITTDQYRPLRLCSASCRPLASRNSLFLAAFSSLH